MTSAIPFNAVMMQIPERPARTHVAPHDLHKAVDKAFITALLLTKSAQRAEEAILASNRVMDVGSTLGEALLREALNAALKPQSETEEQPEDLQHASSMLPCELQRVLHLPTALRHCFVLRFLVGLSREACADLLHLEVHKVDERARRAMLELPAIQGNRVC